MILSRVIEHVKAQNWTAETHVKSSTILRARDSDRE